MTASDAAWMQRAIELSRLGYPAPNPHVGCVIAREGCLVGEGFHEYAGGPHAEVVALGQAGTSAKDATAYVTLEPCNHQGRTGPCSEALIQAGVRRVVVAVGEVNAKATGGLDRLRQAGIEAECGLLSVEAEEANVMWLTATRRSRPYVVAKVAMSLDGRIALASGESKWITGMEARTKAHELRAECGAVLVGSGTVIADDPELTVRHIQTINQPVRIVLDPLGETPNTAKVYDEAALKLRVVQAPVFDFDLEVATDHGQIPLDALFDSLFERGITSLLVEGGAFTVRKFLEAGLVDRLEIFIAPKLLGNGQTWFNSTSVQSLATTLNFRFDAVQTLGQDVWITAFPCNPR